eukprot:RCo031178
MAGKELLTGRLRQSLKNTYTLVGTHSAVKPCRWTLSMLRARGGCYKHTFYGIESHRCVQLTPSLACANRCVFCWRLQDNPVTKEWAGWEVDDPEWLLEHCLAAHCQHIKELRGASGVIPERLLEGLLPRHLALSLVGEPVLYPRLNAMLNASHRRGLSTFLVTNGQFPDLLAKMDAVTQVYVSVDAPDEDGLRRIDRPLFPDSWKRLMSSLEVLRSRHERTVFRLTLVKEWNMESVEGYARLIAEFQPDFVELKAVAATFSRESCKLSMRNVPWFSEVRGFAQQLAAEVARLCPQPGYELAAEHAHSSCVLLASLRYKASGQWRTWIDFDRFLQISGSCEGEGGGGVPARGVEYSSPTPLWALQPSGMDPAESNAPSLDHRRDPTSGCDLAVPP